jgi:peptide deformylase
LVNPEIIQASEEKVSGTEGCLSIPGLVGDVDRHTKIVVKGLNRFGKPIKITAEGWLARIFQHEIDHLEGVVFPDRATKVWKPKEDEELVIAD